MQHFPPLGDGNRNSFQEKTTGFFCKMKVNYSNGKEFSRQTGDKIIMKQYLQHIRAIMVLPFSVTILIPSILCFFVTAPKTDWKRWPLLIAIPLGMIGLGLLVWTIMLLGRHGTAARAPWDPTQKLVVCGPYAYVRNPMISGVLMILLGGGLVTTNGNSCFFWWNRWFSAQ